MPRHRLANRWHRACRTLIPLVALLELYILLSRENGVDRGRRLGDEWAKTRVLVEQKPAPPEEE